MRGACLKAAVKTLSQYQVGIQSFQMEGTVSDTSYKSFAYYYYYLYPVDEILRAMEKQTYPTISEDLQGLIHRR